MAKNKYYLGIDAGSSYIKLAMIDETETMVAHGIIPRGDDIDAACRRCFDELLTSRQIDRTQIVGIIATGYGRKQVTFADDIITEITALATGAYAMDSDIRYVIDIGGQDSKVIALDASGKVLDFMMNHKCAAGTGKFLEVTSASLGVAIEQLGPLSQQADKSLQLSSTCTVFAESEIVSCIAKGEKKENIIRALHQTISGQIMSLFSHISTTRTGKITFDGGLALNIGMIDELSEKLSQTVWTPPQPQYVGACGAAVLLKRKMKKVKG